MKTFDCIVIGGGINGVGIANDAQGRGLDTLLLEKQDLAQATSSASSKLIHGGLRYLEHYEFRLVREALSEREILLKKAPHIIKPLRFQLPHMPHLRPVWMIRAGLFLYDQLGKRKLLPGSRHVEFKAESSPLKPEILRGFEYSDCWVDDSRLVALNAIQFTENGGVLKTRHECTAAKVERGLWTITARDTESGLITTYHARSLINAAGPWVKSFLTQNMQRTSPYGVRLIKGSHVVVPKLYEGDNAFILQNDDSRIVFVIPYLNEFSIVGTTDVEYQGDPSQVAISTEETHYLCDVVNKHFAREMTPQEVIWSWSGVRPLCDDESDDPKAITRDYTLELEKVEGLPLLSVFGGKLTTYRRLAESAMKQIRPFFPLMGEEWTSEAVLPGGDLGHSPKSFIQGLLQKYDYLDSKQAKRIATAYGSRCHLFLTENAKDQGQHFGAGLYQAEVDYLIKHEFAKEVEDVLWRRSKLGLFLKPLEVLELATYLESHKKNKVKGVSCD